MLFNLLSICEKSGEFLKLYRFLFHILSEFLFVFRFCFCLCEFYFFFPGRIFFVFFSSLLENRTKKTKKSQREEKRSF